jgi:DNA-binding transcriptional ArsR family regulator
MITIHMTPDDFSELRFAFSPLTELVMSVKVLQDPTRHALHIPWVSETRPLVGTVDISLLLSLVARVGCIPDFLTPPPDGPYPDFGQELARLEATPADEVVRELESYGRLLERSGAGGLPNSAMTLLDEPQDGMRKLVEALRTYWQVAFERHWPRIRALLEGDVLYRARRLALEGPEGLFQDLHQVVSWRDGNLLLNKSFDAEVRPGGRGLVFVPTAFCWPELSVIIDEPWQPTILYPPRGIANLWEAGETSAESSLDVLLGRTRAALVRSLEVPMTTSELAQRMDVTPGAISQQLGHLRRAGVIEAQRSGRGVYSRLTPLGTSLVSLLDSPARAAP